MLHQRSHVVHQSCEIGLRQLQFLLRFAALTQPVHELLAVHCQVRCGGLPGQVPPNRQAVAVQVRQVAVHLVIRRTLRSQLLLVPLLRHGALHSSGTGLKVCHGSSRCLADLRFQRLAQLRLLRCKAPWLLCRSRLCSSLLGLQSRQLCCELSKLFPGRSICLMLCLQHHGQLCPVGLRCGRVRGERRPRRQRKVLDTPVASALGPRCAE